MMRILVSGRTADTLGPHIAQAAGPEHVFVRAEDVEPGADFDVAFVSRDVTGRSTKHEVRPATQHFHDLLRKAPGLAWVHTHSAGADRAVFGELRARGVEVTTSSGANANVVAQTAVAGVLALARRFPQLMAAQRERRWEPQLGFDAWMPDQARHDSLSGVIAGSTRNPWSSGIPSALPRELAGQTAVIVGWGPVGKHIAALLRVVGLHCIAVRRNAGPADEGVEIISYEDLGAMLPRADWLILACPLTPRTRGLIDAHALARLPPGAHLVNVARGEVAVEKDIVAALRSGALAGAYLDVFEHEPLPADSSLWDLNNVIVTPHMAGHSDGNEERVAAMFLANLGRWREGAPLVNRID